MHRFAIAAALCVAAAAPAAAASVDPALAAAIAAPSRSDANKARDQYRHPAETLTYFGLKPTMTVVEVAPGGGWYSEILAPYLAAKGHYIAAFEQEGPNGAKALARYKDKLAAAKLDKVTITDFAGGKGPIAPAGTADLVLTFRNVHNWTADGSAGDAFKSFYAALKKGGVLGIVDHRRPENQADVKDSGYVKVSDVRKLAEAAGFKFVGASDINANPKDTHDYPKGVWTLPPTYAEGDKDKAKYAAIGESDRMTLKFVKP
jgi:predicted methyltransferase